MDLSFEEIVNACSGQILVKPNSESFKLATAVIDSRKVKENDIFFAMIGQKVDGHNFINNAIDQKASMVICEKTIDANLLALAKEKNTAILKVLSCEKALQNIALAWRNKLNATVLGITGSVGKTSSKQLCYDVLSYCFRAHRNLGNLNNELGLPITICCCDKDCQFLITEMGMSAKGEIEQLCKIAKPHWGLISNIGTAHIEYLKSQDNIAKAKSELPISLPKNSGVMFLNKADKYCDFIIEYAKLKENNIEVVLYGDDKFNDEYNSSQVWYDQAKINDDGTWTFVLCIYDKNSMSTKKARCNLQLKGRHNILNSCGAAAVGFYAGMEIENIVNAISKSLPEHGRQEILKSKYGFSVINDAYNANPVSMAASVEMLSSISCKAKKFLFLGDMFELGEYSKKGHIDVGECVDKYNIDYLICVGEHSKDIINGAKNNNMDPSNMFWFKDVDNAKNKLLDLINKDDIVLFKASNSMGFYKIVDELV